jgi:hypothetical protein
MPHSPSFASALQFMISRFTKELFTQTLPQADVDRWTVVKILQNLLDPLSGDMTAKFSISKSNVDDRPVLQRFYIVPDLVVSATIDNPSRFEMGFTRHSPLFSSVGKTHRRGNSSHSHIEYVLRLYFRKFRIRPWKSSSKTNTSG